MRKSLIMGTKEDVAKRSAKQAISQSVHHSSDNRTSVPVRRIVTFNHPSIMEK